MKPEARRIWAASNLNESLGSRSSSSTAAEEGHRVQKVEAELEKFPTRPKISQQMEKKFRMIADDSQIFFCQTLDSVWRSLYKILP